MSETKRIQKAKQTKREPVPISVKSSVTARRAVKHVSKLAILIEVAQSAADWLTECEPYTDQRERGDELQAALDALYEKARGEQ